MKKIKEQKIYIIDNNYNILVLDYEKEKYNCIVDIFKKLEYDDVKRLKNKTEFIKYLKEIL